jgi:cathepsin A (carboxypeptidase C)
MVNLDLNGGYVISRDTFRPMSPKLEYILDSGKTVDGTPIRLLVMNGNEDYIVNTPGQKWVLENLKWSGQAEYTTAKWHTWNNKTDVRPFEGSGFWKQTEDSRLVFIGVDEGGHEAPRFAGAATWQIIQNWLGGWRF